MSSPTPPVNSFLNGPLVNTITGYFAYYQGQDYFSKERLHSLRHYFLITIGFLVLLYCLIHIQILFFWLLKFIFRIIFKIISMIFWLPLKSVRFFIPKSIDYDILFPLFWLCSISSFYISKLSHENICRFYDQHLVSRHPIFKYDRTKREEFKRHLFIVTFITLFLLQALFILLPIALSIRHQHENPIRVSSPPVVVPKQTTSTTTATSRKPTTKSAVNDVVETFFGNLCKRFIDAFSDENEKAERNEKRSPLVSDEKLEDTFKTIQKSIQTGVKKLKTNTDGKEAVEVKKSSRFQRWIVHYLKAPFQKWEGRKKIEADPAVEQKEFEDEEEEHSEIESSSSILDADETDEEGDSSESDDEEEDEEHLTVTDRIKTLGEQLKEKVKSKISSSKDEDSDEEDSESDEDDDDTDEEEDAPSLKERLLKPVEAVRKIGEQAAKKVSSSTDSDEEEEENSDDESDEDDEESQPTTASDKIKEQLAKPIETMKTIVGQVGDQLRNKLPSSPETDEESGYESDEEEEDEQPSKLTETINKVKSVATNIKEKITSSTDTDDSDSDSDDEDEDEEPATLQERLSKPIEAVRNAAENIKDKITPSTDKEDEDSDEDDEESVSIVDRIEERLSKPIETVKNAVTNIKEKITSQTDTEDEDEDSDDEQVSSTISQDKITSSSDKEDEESDSDDEESASLTDQIKDRLSQPIETVKSAAASIKDKITFSSDEEDDSSDEESVSITERLSKPVETVQTVAASIKDKITSSSDNEDEDSDSDDEESASLTDQIKDRLSQPVETIKNAAASIKDKITSSTDSDDDDDDDDDSDSDSDEDDKETAPVTEKIKERLSKPLETVKSFGEKILDNVRSQFSSSDNPKADDSDVETDEENEEEEHPTLLDRVKENVVKPIGEAATSLRDKLPSATKKEEDLSFIDRTKKSAGKVKDQIASNADELKHKASDLVNSVEDLASNAYEKSVEYVKDKADQIKKTLPKLKRNKPVETKATKVKRLISSKAAQLKDSVVSKLKSLKKKKKPKSLAEKAKDKFKSLSESLREKVSGQKKKKKNNREKASELLNNVKSKLRVTSKLNGWLDDAWNIWHLTKTKLSHVFSSSTKHARHLPRHNATSFYTAFTDLKCYNPTKKLSRYRSLKRQHSQFLDTYRRHSPFPIYLSVLKSNGPRCYRQYPDSSCGLISKSATRPFATQVYRFIRFWAIVGLLVVLLAYLYRKFTHRQQSNPSSFRAPKDSDRSSNKQQATTVSTKTDIPRTVTTQKVSSNPQQTITSSSNTEPLNEQVAQQLRLWLEREQNDGFRNLSETCRTAINSTFVKHLERLSVETLQFANARIRNVAQNKNNNKTAEVPAEKIIINAVLDIDHLILNIVNTFKEQHFSFDTAKLSGQLHALLVINPNRYTIEASLQQLQISPANIIDPNSSLSAEEKQSLGKLLDETITRTVVRCSFHLSDNQENTNHNTLQNSSPVPHADTNKTYSSSNQLSTTSTQSTGNRSRQPTPNRYQPLEPPPKLLVNDSDPYAYPNESSLDREPKRLLVRIVKAVKLHDVEQPFCILQLNHPQQSQQTSVAKNGLNPFWDERFLFECDDQSNQIHLQIIDRKMANKRTGSNYVDTVYADVSVPFSYATSTVYKQDIQISPQHPESIIRIEFSTLSEEEALAANNGYDVESITDSQTWTYNDREANKIEHDYPQRYQQSLSNDYLSSSYDNNPLSGHYGLSTSSYDDDRAYSSTIPRSVEHHSTAHPFAPSLPITPRDDGFGGGKPKKSKSFMSSLKHLTLPRRKAANKDKHNQSMSSQASSTSQLNTSIQLPQTNPVSHSLSSALPGPRTDVFLANTTDPTPMRRSRSISQSFKNLFRSSSKKKGNAARADALGEYENVDNRTYLSTSTPTTKKLSFLARRKSKQKAKQSTNLSTNSLSSYDCSRMESVRDTPVRANVGHPVTMTKSLVR